MVAIKIIGKVRRSLEKAARKNSRDAARPRPGDSESIEHISIHQREPLPIPKSMMSGGSPGDEKDDQAGKPTSEQDAAKETDSSTDSTKTSVKSSQRSQRLTREDGPNDSQPGVIDRGKSTSRPKRPMLSFRNVAIEGIPQRFGRLVDASFELNAGELGIIHYSSSVSLPIADLAVGLLAPLHGEILFQGKCWNKLAPNLDASRRGRTSRVFAQWGWVSNLTIAENITLSQRHHTSRPLNEIDAEANELSKKFGFEGLPDTRPAFVSVEDSVRSQWVRAFLGKPELVILERPLRENFSPYTSALQSEVKQACERGGAVLWMTSRLEVLHEMEFQDVKRWEVRGAGIFPV